jgi:hypothetical protein
MSWSLALLALTGMAHSFQIPQRSIRQSSRLYQADKPTRVQIEEAAGQKETEASISDMGTVSGVKTEPPAECKCYTNCPLLVNHPEVNDRLAKLTEKRDYSLFVAEKAAKYLVDDIFSAPKRHNGESAQQQQAIAAANGTPSKKEKLVILGAGWGSAAFLRGIDTERYDVTVISPRNYFIFTPMLAGAAVGTVDARSITQPIRSVSTVYFCLFLYCLLPS